MTVITTDAELVAAARQGDAAGLGLLLERHRAGMLAAALAVLGWSGDAEDVVQDAFLTALRRLADLRDPAAAGAWLRAIARNQARMHRRSDAFQTASATPDLSELPDRGPTPEQVVEQLALRDWVWTAIGDLPESLQITVMLRYFSDVRSYQQIAAVSQVPVGTVRSRLNEARRRLGRRLITGAVMGQDDRAAVVSRLQRAQELLAAERGHVHHVLADLAAPGFRLIGPQGQTGHGPELLAHIMHSDLDAGVRQRLIDMTSSQTVTIMECQLLSPPDDPDHCPPGVLWLLTWRDHRVAGVRLYHPQPAA
jgi:RNA polymerase sigma-70 factor (ECF subfamily)